MKTTILSSLFLGLSLLVFCQITNLPALGPVANTNAIPIQNNVNPHQHESNVNLPMEFKVSQLLNPIWEETTDVKPMS